MNATSYYWSYINFYASITYASYIYYTYNYDKAAEKQISQENRCAGVSFSQNSKPSDLQRY